MSGHEHRPDPGRARAVELILEWFARPDMARRHAYRPELRVADGDPDISTPARQCLGCGQASSRHPGNWSCHGGGPSISEWCSACYAETGRGEVWRHSLSWAQFYRLTGQRVAAARVSAGQTGMFA